MSDANLYAKILGLRQPWRVLEVTVNEVPKTITVIIGPEPGSPLRCPQCRQICPGYDRRRRCEPLKSVSMDMSRAYIKAALDSLPDALEKVAFDHFHVAKALSKAVDNTRKSELHRVDDALRRDIHRSRYDWLRRGSRLSDFARERMQALSASLRHGHGLDAQGKGARDLACGLSPKTVGQGVESVDPGGSPLRRRCAAWPTRSRRGSGASSMSCG